MESGITESDCDGERGVGRSRATHFSEEPPASLSLARRLGRNLFKSRVVMRGRSSGFR